MEQIAYRISRLISLITIIVWIYCGYYIYQFTLGSASGWNIRNTALVSSSKLDALFQSYYNLWYAIIFATFILLVFNYVAFGKISVWIEEPAPKEEE